MSAISEKNGLREVWAHLFEAKEVLNTKVCRSRPDYECVTCPVYQLWEKSRIDGATWRACWRLRLTADEFRIVLDWLEKQAEQGKEVDHATSR